MTSVAAVTLVLLDLDGVIRHFDPTRVAATERKHGLAPGALRSAAFRSDVVQPVITGKITRAEWMKQIGEAVNSPEAAFEWLGDFARGAIDHAMLALVDELRAGGVTVAILTNGTDTIPLELDHAGITDRFDAIFNTAEIGFAKPDVRAFQAVVDALDVDPATVFFTDDSPDKLAGAIELGMVAEHFTSVAALRASLEKLDLVEKADG